MWKFDRFLKQEVQPCFSWKATKLSEILCFLLVCCVTVVIMCEAGLGFSLGRSSLINGNEGLLGLCLQLHFSFGLRKKYGHLKFYNYFFIINYISARQQESKHWTSHVKSPIIIIFDFLFMLCGSYIHHYINMHFNFILFFALYEFQQRKRKNTANQNANAKKQTHKQKHKTKQQTKYKLHVWASKI